MYPRIFPFLQNIIIFGSRLLNLIKALNCLVVVYRLIINKVSRPLNKKIILNYVIQYFKQLLLCVCVSTQHIISNFTFPDGHSQFVFYIAKFLITFIWFFCFCFFIIYFRQKRNWKKKYSSNVINYFTSRVTQLPFGNHVDAGFFFSYKFNIQYSPMANIQYIELKQNYKFIN